MTPPMLGLRELTERKGAAKGLTRSVTDAHVMCPRCLICNPSSTKSPRFAHLGDFNLIKCWQCLAQVKFKGNTLDMKRLISEI